MKVRTVVLELDDDDFDAVQQAISVRQGLFGGSVLPDGEGNLAGRYVAEICRGWMEMLDAGRGEG
jgi:hypothetical protein